MRRALLLGRATAASVIVEMRVLDEQHRPQSSGPFWQAWTEKADSERKVDWHAVANDWVAGTTIGGEQAEDDVHGAEDVF